MTEQRVISIISKISFLVLICLTCLTVSTSQAEYYQVYGRLSPYVDVANSNVRYWAAVLKIRNLTTDMYLTCFPEDKSTWNQIRAGDYSLIDLSRISGQDDCYIDYPLTDAGYKEALLSVLNHTHKLGKWLQDKGHKVQIKYYPFSPIDYLQRSNNVPIGVRVQTPSYTTARTNKLNENLDILDCTVDQSVINSSLNSSLLWNISTAATNGTAMVSGSGTSPMITYTTSTTPAQTDSFVIKTMDTAGGSLLITVNTVDKHNKVLNHFANTVDVTAGYNILPTFSFIRGAYLYFSYFSENFFSNAGATKSYSVEGMPPGLSFNSTYRLFSGTPKAPLGKPTLLPAYTITVYASDANGGTDSTTFMMKIANTLNNDSGIVVPAWANSLYSYSIPENSANGTPLTPDTAITASGTPTPKYRIVGGNYNGIFAIDTTTGQITVANNTMLKRSNPGITAMGYYVKLIVEAFNTSTYQEYSNAATIQIQIKE